MPDRITNDRSQDVRRYGGVEQTQRVDAERGGGEVGGSRPSLDRPVQSGSEGALRKLDSKAIGVVLDGVHAQLEGALRELSKDRVALAQVAPRLRAAEKQLSSLSAVDDGARPMLAELAGLAHRVLEASMGVRGAEKGLGTLPADLSDRVAELAAAPLLAELASVHPRGGAHVDGLIDLTGQRGPLLRELSRMYPGADAFGGIDALVGKLDKDLGGIKDELTSLMRERKIPEKDIQAFFRAFAEVRQGYEVGAARGDDMQRTNWVHTRIEVLHTLESAAALDLGPRETLASLLGSLTSDSFKDKSLFSLLWHNRGGAELVLPLVVARHFPGNQALLEDSRMVALEHQITPPIFMAGAAKNFLGGAAGVDEIFGKINAPIQAPQKNGEIIFSEEAAASLRSKGLPGWAVPTPGTRHHGASLAAIVGDVLQYPSPDGIIKIACDLRDPGDARPFMRDSLIKDAVNSSLVMSLKAGMSVVDDPRLKGVADRAAEEMGRALEGKIYPEIERRLRKELGVREGAETPAIPYWNAAIDFQAIGPDVRASIDRVKRVLAEVVAEHGGVPLDPFGHVEKRRAEG
jgi:hypothetical protein